MASRSAVVVAGGRSRRFGDREKALIDVDGAPMLARVARSVTAVPGDLVINCRPDQHRDFHEALTAAELPCSYRFAIDRSPDRGPLAGLQRGLEVATGEVAVVLGCDVALFDAHLVDRLLERHAASGGEALVPQVDGRPQPLCAVYDVEPALEAATRLLDADSRRLCALLAELTVTTLDEATVAEWTDPIRFHSVDTPAELEFAREFLRRRGSEPPSDEVR